MTNSLPALTIIKRPTADQLIECHLPKPCSIDKAKDITVLDVHELTTLADKFVICHAQTDVQIKALADNVAKETKEQLDEKPWKEEGRETRRWVILDYVNVVVHIFKEELREYYALERMWNDASIKKIEDEA
ncbi:MAG: ribosome silencing factor [Fodinibius sp.]|nr:ribosome silencing factor [Fodinibius sp.]